LEHFSFILGRGIELSRELIREAASGED